MIQARKRSLRYWLAATGTAILLTGCGGTAQTSSGSSPSNSTATQSPSQTSASTNTLSGTLHFYTSQPDADAKQLVDAFRKQYPNVDVQTFRSGTEQVIAKIEAEKQAGQVVADVVLLADAPTFQSLKEQGLLLSYASPEASQIPADLQDPDHAYTPTKIMPTGILYNTQKVKDPTTVDWSTLISSEAKNQVVMPSPLYSGAAAYMLGIFTRDPSFGWPYYEKLRSNDVLLVQGNGDVAQKVASGERSYGVIVDFTGLRQKEQGSPVEFIYPSSGVPVITEPVGILKETQNESAAKAFVDFILSPEGQQLEVSLGYMPIISGITPPPGRPDPESLQIRSTPIAELASGREADKQRFAQLFGQ